MFWLELHSLQGKVIYRKEYNAAELPDVGVIRYQGRYFRYRKLHKQSVVFEETTILDIEEEKHNG